ncbi:MAG: hypothetical protein M1818_002467 [Claussenomyces sp. TS43310]|nr:MAG: hypothetical protein M1818_002467 [Claussenomyces sp. TS43310]
MATVSSGALPPLKKVGVAKVSDLTPSKELEELAATAALYVEAAPLSESKDANRFMEGDKLSSAGAAASLKYASPKDLPSFPSAGLRNDDSAAGAAASLGWSNQKPFEYWKPDGTSSSASKAAMLAKDYKAPPLWQPAAVSTSASKAAMLAKDYKAPPLWHPEQSSNAAKASLIATKDGGKVEIWRPEATAWGNSAATQAMKSEHTLSPQLDYGYTELGRKGSVLAATGAMSGNRKRSESTPVARAPLYPDEANATRNALKAATLANAPTKRSKADTTSDASVGVSPLIHMPKEMFTSRPPVQPEVDERKRSDVLHASAVALARSMYTVRQRKIEEAKVTEVGDSHYAAMAVHGRQASTSTIGNEPAPMRLNSLQEAAQKLAHERLVKLHDEHAQNREYRDYYADPPSKSRLSIRGRPQRRASSEGQLDDDYEAQQIRSQMSLFTSNLSRVDSKQRQSDRDALMAAAQRNVTARLSLMDEKTARDNPNRMSQSKLSEWEIKAHAAAQKNSDSRMTNHGRISIGGGAYVNQSAVDLIARNNVQPVLDEINEKVQAQLERDAALRMEMEATQRAAENEKARQREVKDINKRLAQQDKEEQKARRAEEKAREKEMKTELKRAETERKRKSRDTDAAANAVVTAPEDVGDESAVAEPADAEIVETEQAAQEPLGTEAVVTEPLMTEAIVTEHVVTEPVLTEAIVAEPVVTEPVMTEAVVTEPVVTEPAHAEPVETRAEESLDYPSGATAPQELRTSMELQQQQRLDEIATVRDDSSPTSPNKAKGWRRIFSRRMSRGKSGGPSEASDTSKPFVGGVALTGAGSSTNAAEADHSSIYDATPVQTHAATVVDERGAGEEDRGRIERRATSPVSSLTTSDRQMRSRESSHEAEFEEAHDHFEDLALPPKFATEKASSPSRASKFTEVV